MNYFYLFLKVFTSYEYFELRTPENLHLIEHPGVLLFKNLTLPQLTLLQHCRLFEIQGIVWSVNHSYSFWCPCTK